RRAHPRVKFLVTSRRLMKERAAEAGVLEPALAFGAEVTLDTCILASPMLPPEIKTLMTNSAKYAYYAPSLLNTRVTFGSLADCVRSAIEGRVVRDETLWQSACSTAAPSSPPLPRAKRWSPASRCRSGAATTFEPARSSIGITRLLACAPPAESSPCRSARDRRRRRRCCWRRC